MKITQAHVDSLEDWIENRKEAYLRRGFALAAQSGSEALSEFSAGEGLTEEDAAKPLSSLRAELDLAEEFYRDARKILNAGRQGG